MRQKIVLTGGPSAGKTTVALALVKAFSRELVMVPESATILFHGGFVRRFYPEGVKCQQRAIYAIQCAQEELFALENPRQGLICDRGTLDGLAYWPGQESEFLLALRTSRDSELSRYGWVLHLDVAPAASYNHGQNNAYRVESQSEAIELNLKVRQAWRGHPRLIVIPSQVSFADKVQVILRSVRMILDGEDLAAINQFIGSFSSATS